MKRNSALEAKLNKTLSQQNKLINELKKENYRLKNILEKLPGSVYCKNDKGAYLYCNDFVLEMANLKSYSEIIGKTDFDMPWKEYAAELRKLDEKVINSKTLLEFEEHPKFKNKKVIMLTRKMPFLDEKGNVVGIIGISLDITERKKMEKNLRIAKEKAEVANQAKTEFLENMRHDIRTPLSGIVGCAQLIQMQADNPKKVTEYADDLVQSSDALLGLLNEVLESIKVASGEIPLLKKRFSLRTVLEQIIRLNQSQAAVKNLALKLNYDGAIPVYIMGDPIRVQRIILELVTNALKFTDKGKIKVSACLIKEETHPDRIIIKLSVSDTGEGIPKAKQNEVYTRFKRLTPSYQGIYPGAGLGLSVVKQFMDDLGGEIHLESDIGKGSQFICLIPFQKPLLINESGVGTIELPEINNTLINKQQVTMASSASETTISNGSRILVVEDQAIAARVAKNILSELDCQVDIAPDGKTALERVEKQHYDLVLMDVGLPDSDGCEITRRIRLKQWKRNPSMPIVGLTAHIETKKKQSCLANGMNAVYIKPLTPEKTTEILNAFIPYQSHLQATTDTDHNPLNSLQDFALIDVDRAIQLMGSKEFAKETLDLLAISLAEELEIIKQHHQANNWPAIRAMAHKWRGGASYCGATRLEQACQQLEVVLRTESFKGAEEFYQRLIQVVEATKEATVAIDLK